MDNEYKMIQAIPALILYGFMWKVIGLCRKLYCRRTIYKNSLSYKKQESNMDEAIKLASLHPTTQVNIGEGLGWTIQNRPVYYLKTKNN